MNQVPQGFRDELQALLPRLWRFSLSLTKHHTLAQDLVQDSCVRAMERCAQFEPGTRFDAWVFRIARSIWLNDLRSRRIRETDPDCDPDDLAGQEHGPDRMVLRSQVFTQVMALPDTQREAVFLVYIEGFSYAEAAVMMDIPIGTVMSRLASARKRLAAELTAEPGSTAAMSDAGRLRLVQGGNRS
jgi:RNA polymerase sigma-70 factor (ECF subfamily)